MTDTWQERWFSDSGLKTKNKYLLKMIHNFGRMYLLHYIFHFFQLLFSHMEWREGVGRDNSYAVLSDSCPLHPRKVKGNQIFQL